MTGFATVPDAAIEAAGQRLRTLAGNIGCERIWGRIRHKPVNMLGTVDPDSDGPAGNAWAATPEDVSQLVLEAAMPAIHDALAQVPEPVARLASIWMESPDTRNHIEDRYPGLAWAIAHVIAIDERDDGDDAAREAAAAADGESHRTQEAAEAARAGGE